MPVYEYGLSFEKGYLFAEIEGRKFVLDTGSPMSMAATPDFSFRGKEIRLPGSVMGLTASQLFGFIGMEVHGLLGTDEDFYPGFGRFETDTYRLEVRLVSRAFSLVAGTLPGMLGLSQSMANADGKTGLPAGLLQEFRFCAAIARNLRTPLICLNPFPFQKPTFPASE